MKIQSADIDDAYELAYLINLAGEGIPFYLWSMMAAPGETPIDVGVQRAARDEGGFSYKHARVIKSNGAVLGMIMSYPLDDPYEVEDLESYPAVVRPLVSLEAKAPGSWYINAIATFEQHRGKGVATQLLNEAEALALQRGVDNVSLIVASENTSARGLYLRRGYETQASLPVIHYPGCSHGGRWELMIKSLANNSAR